MEKMKKLVSTKGPAFKSAAEMRASYRAQRIAEKGGLGRIIASRVLTEENARNSKVIIRMGALRRAEADHWLCPFHIEGIVEAGIHYAHGVDALQSIILALAGIRFHLNRTGRPFVWFGDDHGIPRRVSTDYGRTFAQRVDRAIERESKSAQMRWLRTRKVEIASAQAQLKVLKKGMFHAPARWRRNLKAEITKREAQLKAAKESAARREANLKKWKP
jgi:hypothetical protein